MVADRYNNRICLYDATSAKFLTSFGHLGALDGELASPYGCAVASGSALLASSDVFVADKDNNRIQQLSMERQGTCVATFGSPTARRYARLTAPHYCALSDDARRLFVADTSANRICIYDTRDSKQFVGSFDGDEQLSYPKGIAVDGDRVAVADGGNSVIRLFEARGNESLSYRSRHSFGGFGAQMGCFKSIEGVCVLDDSSRTIVAADRDNRRVQLF